MREMNPLPYISGEIRKFLLAQPEIVKLLHGGEITTKALPGNLSKPHLTVQAVANPGDDPMLRKPLVQITPWVPSREVTGIPEDPDVTAWKLAAMVGELVGRASNIVIDERSAWTARWIEGPVQLWDRSQGADRVIHYAPTRFRINVRNRSKIVTN